MRRLLQRNLTPPMASGWDPRLVRTTQQQEHTEGRRPNLRALAIAFNTASALASEKFRKAVQQPLASAQPGSSLGHVSANASASVYSAAPAAVPSFCACCCLFHQVERTRACRSTHCSFPWMYGPPVRSQTP